MNLKPLIICHRRNTIKQLLDTPVEYGIEIDVRTFNNKIILNHDPLKKGIILNKWIKKFNHKFLIINIKEEGLEKYVKKILKKKNIQKFFFLDQSFPLLIKTLNSNEKRCAVRFSEFEDIKTVYNLAEKINWVWVDHFSLLRRALLAVEIMKRQSHRCLLLLLYHLYLRAKHTS